jgi:hypothetical protein
MVTCPICECQGELVCASCSKSQLASRRHKATATQASLQDLRERARAVLEAKGAVFEKEQTLASLHQEIEEKQDLLLEVRYAPRAGPSVLVLDLSSLSCLADQQARAER